MKAKEYFTKYVDEDQDEDKYFKVVNTFHQMFLESEDIRKKRLAASDSAIKAILNEQNEKANSFIKKVNKIDNLDIKRNSFKTFIKDLMPELYNILDWSKD